MTAISAAKATGTSSIWRNRRFVAFWTGYTVSQFGDRVTELALPLIAVVILDATPSQVGLLTASVWLPNLIAMFVGTWVDRRARKRRVLAQALLILYASRMLGLSDAVIGLALGIGAAGGIAGALVAPRIARLIGVGRTIMVGAVLFPAPIAIAAAANGTPLTNALVLSAAELLSSIGVMLFDINQNAVITSVTPDHMRGRTAGAFSTINYGSRPAGAVVGGLLGSAIGLRPTLLVAAVGGSLAVVWLLRSPIAHMATAGADPAETETVAAAEDHG